MIPKSIKEWLAEYKVLSKEEIHSYAASVRHNGELIASLHLLIDEQPQAEVLDPICHQLFEFYRSKERELQRFAMELVPPLVWLYLSFVSMGHKSKCGGVEALLLAVYNLEACTSDGAPKLKTFRIPSFFKHSIYHEPQTLSSTPLLESNLSRFDAEHEEYCDGPRPQYESINGQNRHGIIAYLLQCYHGDIANLSSRSHKIFCKMCSRIVSTGFNTSLIQQDDGNDDDIIHSPSMSASTQRVNQSGELHPRISVSPALLIDMLSCLYYIMFNGQDGPGGQAIVDIHYRAWYELFPDVLLVTNAIRNSLRENPSGQPDDGPIGLSLALSPASSSYALSKTAITNASFRTRKLPDDIPVQPSTDTPKLMTIDEDESNTKTKGWKGKLTKKDKTEKSRSRGSDVTLRSGISNGDTSVDGLHVTVSRASQRTVVDNIEMTPFSSKHKDADNNTTPYSGKHNSPTTKSSSAIKTTVSNKDVRNAKLSSTGHTRNPSGGSNSLENYSTDL